MDLLAKLQHERGSVISADSSTSNRIRACGCFTRSCANSLQKYTCFPSVDIDFSNYQSLTLCTFLFLFSLSQCHRVQFRLFRGRADAV